MHRQVEFIWAQTAWALVALMGLILLDIFSLSVFAVVTFVGFLVVTEMTSPFAVTPRWRRRLVWIALLGLLGVGYIGLRQVLELLSTGGG